MKIYIIKITFKEFGPNDSKTLLTINYLENNNIITTSNFEVLQNINSLFYAANIQIPHRFEIPRYMCVVFNHLGHIFYNKGKENILSKVIKIIENKDCIYNYLSILEILKRKN